jgi:hypothetical protein
MAFGVEQIYLFKSKMSHKSMQSNSNRFERQCSKIWSTPVGVIRPVASAKSLGFDRPVFILRLEKIDQSSPSTQKYLCVR